MRMVTEEEPAHQILVYEKFDFEEIIYLYVWGILVGITVITNVLAVYVFMHKSFRNLTNLLIVAIALSDSLTGLVTFPTYLLVYTSVEPPAYEYSVNNEILNHDYMYDVGDGNVTSTYLDTNYELYTNDTMVEVKQAYFLDKVLCDAFMISKYYLAKVFHTISIWHTLYLGIQRYIAVRYHMKARFLLTARRKLIGCVTIIFVAPVLHLYHLFNNKKVDGYCAWKIEKDCSETCIYFWMTLLFRHLIPCFVLSVITVLFVRHLICNRQMVNERRVAENRRSSKIVIGIVIVFLFTEVPYGLFLLYSTIIQHSELGANSNFKANRAVHVTYEIFMLLSSNVNFCVYVTFHQRFRAKLLKIICCCCLDKRSRQLSVSTETDCAASKTAADIEMRPLN